MAGERRTLIENQTPINEIPVTLAQRATQQ
jgi:hypothetical protein